MNLDEIESRLNTIFDEAYYRQIVFFFGMMRIRNLLMILKILI